MKRKRPMEKWGIRVPSGEVERGENPRWVPRCPSESLPGMLHLWVWRHFRLQMREEVRTLLSIDQVRNWETMWRHGLYNAQRWGRTRNKPATRYSNNEGWMWQRSEVATCALFMMAWLWEWVWLTVDVCNEVKMEKGD